MWMICAKSLSGLKGRFDSVAAITLLPASEVPLSEAAISRFRTGYLAAFGPSADPDAPATSWQPGPARAAWAS